MVVETGNAETLRENPYGNKTMFLKLKSKISTFILIISLFQIGFYFLSYEEIRQRLIFMPKRKREIWRFFTYMLLHRSWLHLMANVISQCLFVSCMHYHHGSLKISVIYLTGGAMGALFSSFLSDDWLVGASAGAYGLLLSIVAEIILNDIEIRIKVLKATCVCFLILTDILVTVIQMHINTSESISWKSHIAGAICGFFCGLLLLRNKSFNNEDVFKYNDV